MHKGWAFLIFSARPNRCTLLFVRFRACRHIKKLGDKKCVSVIRSLRYSTVLPFPPPSCWPSMAARSESPTPSKPTRPGSASRRRCSGIAADGTVNKVIVTARRRAELIQDVPGAVTALSGAELEKQAIPDITALAEKVPNTTLKASRGTNYHADRLHPRRRPARPGRRLRARRRHLPRRRLPGPSAGRPDRHLRRRAHRSAARPAGHAVRPQHHRRRRQVRHPQAGLEADLRRQGHLRQLQPERPGPQGQHPGFRHAAPGRDGRHLQPRRLRAQRRQRPRKLQQGRRWPAASAPS